MSSLFKSLFKLQLRNSNKPKEDYLTEIFAYCLEADKALLADFLKAFNIHQGGFVSDRVTTQFTLSALEDHRTDSRPDVAIFLDNRIIFIENKIDAAEGEDQLSRYAEHLDKYRLPKTLVYITRDFDPKNEDTLFAKCQDKASIKFVQARWFDVYIFLKKYSTHSLVAQLLKFMEELGLSSSKQFSPTDILTLNNFSRVRKMMNEALDGEVLVEFEKLGKAISSRNTAMSQLRRKDRYIYYADQKHGMWIGIGFWLNSFTEKSYPDVRFIIEIDPKSPERDSVVSTFKEIIKKNDIWKGYNLDDPTSWASINLQAGLNYFLDGEDHIKNIKSYFGDCLKNLREIRTEFTMLPWRD